MGKEYDITAGAVPPFDPPRTRSEVDGYEIKLSRAIGYEIWLTYRILNTPSAVGFGPLWALTFTGAHRKARRAIARLRRREELDQHVTRWPA